MSVDFLKSRFSEIIESLQKKYLGINFDDAIKFCAKLEEFENAKKIVCADTTYARKNLLYVAEVISEAAREIRLEKESDSPDNIFYENGLRSDIYEKMDEVSKGLHCGSVVLFGTLEYSYGQDRSYLDDLKTLMDGLSGISSQIDFGPQTIIARQALLSIEEYLRNTDAGSSAVFVALKARHMLFREQLLATMSDYAFEDPKFAESMGDLFWANGHKTDALEAYSHAANNQTQLPEDQIRRAAKFLTAGFILRTANVPSDHPHDKYAMPEWNMLRHMGSDELSRAIPDAMGYLISFVSDTSELIAEAKAAFVNLDTKIKFRPGGIDHGGLIDDFGIVTGSTRVKDTVSLSLA